MRKKVALILTFVMMLSFTACQLVGGDKDLKGAKESGTVDLIKNRNRDVIHCFTDSVISSVDYDERAVCTRLTDFSLRLFLKDIEMEEAGKNVLISPTSIISALGMTTYGANGETLAEMESMFGVSRGHLNNYNSSYLQKDVKELKIANSIWFTNASHLTVNDAFLQFDEEYYGASIYETAFNRATLGSINDWVNKKTNGMIKDILDEIPADAVMYLINALAFEAEWDLKYFETDIRKNEEFTNSSGEKQQVDMMSSIEAYYLEDSNAKGFIKNYKGGDYAFVALLPQEGMSVSDYIKTLSGESLHTMLENPIQTSVDAKLPQFSYEYDVQMKDLLKEMGMVAAFDSGTADFSGLAISTKGNIYMNRVIHKTFIEVSPVGTKAGAATVVEMMDESCPMYEEMQEVHLDRPFLYMIIDCENNMPIFIGTVNSVE